NGCFFSVNHCRPTNFAGITDGLSNTACYSEKVMGINTAFNGLDNSRPTSAIMSVNVTTSGNADASPMQYYQACMATPPKPGGKFSTAGAISQGEFWWDGHYETGIYNHIMVPNTWGCDDANNSWV